jgi:hypothetical protein
MNEKVINDVDSINSVDHIDKNWDNLKKAIKAMPIWTFSKIELDNNITNNIRNLDAKIHKKVNDKIKNNELTSEQELKLDWIIWNLASESNDLVLNMINSLDESFPNDDFNNLENKWLEKLTNVLDWIKYYDKKKVVELSESEKLLANYDNAWGFANAYKKNWSIWWMIMSVFK